MKPTCHFAVHDHPCLSHVVILCLFTGTAVTTLSLDRVTHLYRLFRPKLTQLLFEEEIYRLVTIVGTSSEIDTPTPIQTQQNRWATKEDLLAAMRSAFHACTLLYSEPLYKSLPSQTYHSLYPEDVVRSSNGTNVHFAWHGPNIANPEYDRN
jgi:hypothetical protein